MRPIKVAPGFIRLRVVLKVQKVGAALAVPRCVQLISALRATDVVDRLRTSVGRLEIETAMEPARYRRLKRVVVSQSDVARVTRATRPRKTEDLVAQRLVIHRVCIDAV